VRKATRNRVTAQVREMAALIVDDPALVRVVADTCDVTLFRAESSVSYASGHVIFAHDESLMARPFDLDTRQLLGDAFPLAERVTKRQARTLLAIDY
jgi:hypothetical protein